MHSEEKKTTEFLKFVFIVKDIVMYIFLFK